jgi:hypothetical protein
MLTLNPPINFRKDTSYKATPLPQLIDVPEMLFVTVDGRGAPEPTEGAGDTQFQKAMQAMFGIVYTIKFWDKKHTPPAGYAKFNLAPLEALWWFEDGTQFDATRAGDWQWRVMIRLPEFVTPEYFDEVVRELVAQKQSEVYRQARLTRFTEGRCVQIMHIGPYDQEAVSVAKLQAFARERSYEFNGKHHELYFGDPRRTAPEKLRTIIRYPVQKL